jgi:ABC-type glycerol-3-phosphate transport system permease component
MKSRKTIVTCLMCLALAVSIILLLLPLINMIATTFKRNDAVLSTTGMFPASGQWSVENYQGVFQRTDFGHNMGISAIVSTIATSCSVVICVMAGYALSRFKGWFFSLNNALLLCIQVFPGMLLVIPMFMMYSSYRMVNKLPGIIIYYVASNLAFNTMMVTGFFRTIPREIEEAGKIDGCSNMQAFLFLVLPLSLPGVATIGIMSFLRCWNEYTMASLLLRDKAIQTITVGLSKFSQLDVINWGYLMAASTVALLPALVFLLFAQKYLVQGLTSGAVKG